jgi:hypothetical protein
VLLFLLKITVHQAGQSQALRQPPKRRLLLHAMAV